ncbi:MFS transporter [Pseudomonas sp. COR58]|uniref:MFS transporter n=1 Tax=Pseudomonas ekonensis TaxID=2842353 RepID=A0ABS6PFA2_9PSED|nr:YbfB/YjiJ family MFS transporter [Pseudomonas ekonensis]MBV4459150.1 MFS transporter [Pseudomonas ekonensis]
MPPSTSRADARDNSLHRPVLAGLCASLVGIGLARFAYTPLIPELIQAQWFSANDAMYLGAANLVGYLIGALAGRPLARRLGNGNALRLMMLAASLAFFACAFPLSVSWYFGWRLLSGIAGGAIMVLVAATVLPHIPASRKGLASGAIFLGIGLGIAGSGTVVPPLLNLGLQATWLGLGALSLLLTALSWFGWPAGHPSSIAETVKAAPAEPLPKGVYLLFAQYAFMAAGLVPAMVFLVDYVARGLGAGASAGAFVWILYGLGAVIGPVSHGFLADRLGARTGIRLVLTVQAITLGLLAACHSVSGLALLAVLLGSFPPGIVPLALARVHELVPGHDRQQTAWSRATVSFATFQALAGFASSALFKASDGNHVLLFLTAAGSLAVALLLELVAKGLPSPLGRDRCLS